MALGVAVSRSAVVFLDGYRAEPPEDPQDACQHDVADVWPIAPDEGGGYECAGCGRLWQELKHPNEPE